MYINIWDIRNKRWIDKTGIKRVVQLDKEYFEIDKIKYFTCDYELCFIAELK